MSKPENEKDITNNNLLSYINEDFTPLINILNKAMDNYKNVTLYNIKEINKILVSFENNLQSVNKIKIKTRDKKSILDFMVIFNNKSPA